MRMIGNGLRELDRFLSVLLDEVATERGWSGADLRWLTGRRNTANKFALVYGHGAVSGDVVARLRALGRCRNCLFHRDGVVDRGDDRATRTLSTAWPAAPGGGPASIGIGDSLILTADTLDWIGAFYLGLADDLRAGIGPAQR